MSHRVTPRLPASSGRPDTALQNVLLPQDMFIGIPAHDIQVQAVPGFMSLCYQEGWGYDWGQGEGCGDGWLTLSLIDHVNQG